MLSIFLFSLKNIALLWLSGRGATLFGAVRFSGALPCAATAANAKDANRQR
jgi:hypothetical protein